jgi:hypothetical protein
MVQEEALNVTGWWLEQLFYHVNISGFLLQLLERGKWDSCYPFTPGSSPANDGKWEEQHNQPLGKKECEWR